MSKHHQIFTLSIIKLFYAYDYILHLTIVYHVPFYFYGNCRVKNIQND